MLVKRGNVRLIAADPVQRFGQNHREQATLRIPHQLLDAGTQNGACAGDLPRPDNCPSPASVPAGVFVAKTELVFD